MRNDPQEWTIEVDSEGFWLRDEYGEEAESPSYRYKSLKSAKEALDKIIQEDINNYDGPPDGDAWSGGIAENH